MHGIRIVGHLYQVKGETQMGKGIRRSPQRLDRLVQAKRKEIKYVTAQETDHAKQLVDKKRRWYTIWSCAEDEQGWGPESEEILSESYWMGMRNSWFNLQGIRIIGVYASWHELNELGDRLGKEHYGVCEANRLQANMFRRNSFRED